MTIEAISSAIYNHIVAGLTGITANPKISLEQLQDEVVAERNQVLREFLIKGVLTLDEMMLTLDCVDVTCDYMSKCCDLPVGEKVLHFEIPPIFYINGIETIKFIGSVDKKNRYTVYTDQMYRFHKYKKRNSHKPYVYVDTTVNKNGNMDCYIFNLPLVSKISVTALFQDPRKLLEWECCNDTETYLDCGILSDEIMKRLTAKYIQWYRQLASPQTTNDQVPK